MNLERELYNIKVDGKKIEDAGKEAAQVTELYKKFLDDKEGAAAGILGKILSKYKSGKKSLSDDEVLKVAVANSGILKLYYEAATKYLKDARGPAYGKARKLAEKIRKTSSYMKKVAEEVMKYVGKYNPDQLVLIKNKAKESADQVSAQYKAIDKAVTPYIEMYRKK